MVPEPTTPAALFEKLTERKQNDLKHDAWEAAIRQFSEENPYRYSELEFAEGISYEDMRLVVHEDKDTGKYFDIVTGISPITAEEERLRQLVTDFMIVYRDELLGRIKEESSAYGPDGVYPHK
jgi:hypothetical protein